MAKFDRYVLSQLISVFGLASLVLVMVYWINRAVRLFDQIISSGESATVFLELSVLALPNVIKLVMPAASFAAAIYVTNRLSSESELVIVQATGFSPWRMARPVLVFGILVAAFTTLLAHVLVPASLDRLSNRQAEIAENVTSRLLSEGRFLHPSEGVTFYIGEITPEGELRNVFLSDARVPERRVTYTASSALLARSDTGPRLLMFDGMAQTYLPKERRLATTRFSDFAFNIASVIDTPTSGRRQLSEVPTPVLLNPSPEFLAENRFSYPAALREAHGRFNQALQCIVAPLMGFAFLLVGGYSRFGVWWQILAAIAAMALLQSMGSAMANIARDDAGLWPLHYAPQGVGLALILVLLWWAAHPHAFRRRRGGAIS